MLRVHRGLGNALYQQRRLLGSEASILAGLRSSMQRIRQEAAAERVAASDTERYATLPLALRPHASAMEHYVVNTWVKMYPEGAIMRRLQRDIAFRMPKLLVPDGDEYSAQRHSPGKVFFSHCTHSSHMSHPILSICHRHHFLRGKLDIKLVEDFARFLEERGLVKLYRQVSHKSHTSLTRPILSLTRPILPIDHTPCPLYTTRSFLANAGGNSHAPLSPPAVR